MTIRVCPAGVWRASGMGKMEQATVCKRARGYVLDLLDAGASVVQQGRETI